LQGIIFNLLEEVLSRDHGESFWDLLLQETGVEGAYTSIGTYPDAEIVDLISAAAARLNAPADEVLRRFGVAAIPLLQRRYPAFFSTHVDTRSFVLSLNGIIHPEVHKLHPGARCPVFGFEGAVEGPLHVTYDSPRGMCRLAQGFIEGTAGFYNEQVLVMHERCMHNGDAECLLRVDFC
jgi:hypothetical protein